MYLEQLRSFCAVVQHGSFTAAARELYLSQPTVSEHVRSLERAFGTPLLDRAAGRVVPTEAGEAIYRRSVTVVTEVDAMHGEIAALKGLQGGRVVLYASPTPGHYILPLALARFRQRYPDVQVDMQVDRALGIFEHLRHEIVDFGICLGEQAPAGLVAEPLYQDRFVLVSGPNHPLATSAGRVVPPAALAQVQFVALRHGFARDLCDRWLAEAGVDPPILTEFDSEEQIKQVLAGGIGVAFLYRSSVAQEIASGRLRAIPLAGPPLFGRFLLVRRGQRYPSPAARAFLETLLAFLAETSTVSGVNPRAVERFVGPRRARARRHGCDAALPRAGR